MQSLLNDPNISGFLQQIPQKQQIITLKELIYIGIKIVNKEFEQSKSQGFYKQNEQRYPQKENKRGEKGKENKHVQQQQSHQNTKIGRHEEQKRFQNSKEKSKYSANPSKVENQRIESTLLREISKIRMQLESLTNKVYDHCFEDQNQQYNDSDSMDLGYQAVDNLVQYGFNGQNMPTFSPPKDIKSKKDNPFRKQKNNFFSTEPNRQSQDKKRSLSNKKTVEIPEQRNRTRSNVMHLDDTQIRQALYKQDQQIEHQQKRFQKSRSMIQKKHQKKKKDQQNYFYQLAIDKQRIQDLNKIKVKSKSQIQPQRDNEPVKVPNAYKKAKSKIKKLVQRDRLRYQQKVQNYNFQKGFEQYEYSANEEIQDNQQESAQQQEYENEEGEGNSSSNAGFGYNDPSNQQSPGSNLQENTFSNNQPYTSNNNYVDDQQDNINIHSNSSSFSEFSMGSSSRREVGKISRKRPE